MSAIISYKTLQELHTLYVNGKHQVLSKDLGKEDTKNIWFELNDPMRKFLKEVLEKDGINGIRLYFLQNPDTQTDMNGELIPENKIDVDQLCVGLVATKARATQNLNRDADPATTGEDDLTVDPINHGTLCPQLCG
jgi:hypothetical protein